MIRTCKSCNIEKQITDFYAHNCGRRHTCKACAKIMSSIWSKNNKELRSKIVKKSRYKDDVWRNYSNEYKKKSGDVAKRRALKDKRTPLWLSKNHIEQIKALYSLRTRLSNCLKTKFHVDHIIPLRGKKVSGLHVPWNLQVISARKNMTKGNKMHMHMQLARI